MNILKLIGRNQELFTNDIVKHEAELTDKVKSSSFLVIGGAGSIGKAVVKEIFKRNPRKLHVVDISENNMVELVRDIRSAYGYIEGDFQTFAIDIGSWEYDAFIQWDGKYDYVMNLSALKHVRSEKDPFTLMRMIDVNIFNTDKTIRQSIEKGTKKYFCVSTDKAANPVNMMGASKRIMEMFVHRHSENIEVSMARFANVAFSDGSLLHGFDQRIKKQQPIVAPNDIKRYFVIPKEAGELCLMSCLLGENRDVFFPKLSESLHLISFADIAVRYLELKGLSPYLCKDEDEARGLAQILTVKGQWPCLFTGSDTTGEKNYEEFFTDKETLDLKKFQNLGIIKNQNNFDLEKVQYFEAEVKKIKATGFWQKQEIIDLFFNIIPDFGYVEKGKYLDSKM